MNTLNNYIIDLEDLQEFSVGSAEDERGNLPNKFDAKNVPAPRVLNPRLGEIL